MSFQLKKPSVVLKNLSAIVEKKKDKEVTSTKSSFCEVSSQKEENKKGHKT